MSNAVEAKVNSFCWVELASKDVEAAKKFYAGLFGWTYQQEALPGDMGHYITSLANDLPAAAMFQMPEKMANMNIPSHWGSYIRVENVDETLKRAQALGGEVLQEAMDVMNEGSMAALKDPCGSVFHIWQKKRSAGATVQNQVQGAFSWNELMVHDAKKAKSFYQELFSWRAVDNDFNGMTYTSLKNADDSPAGGLMQISKDMADMPPHWAVYFTVNNMDEAVSYVKDNGGNVFFGPQTIDGMGRFAAAGDPQGAPFSMFEFEKKA